MTHLAYMIRADWAQEGTAMVPQSKVVREWVGGSPYLFAVTDTAKFSRDGRGGDIETADFIAPEKSSRHVFNISDFAGVIDQNKVIDHAIVVLHPYKCEDLEVLREATLSGRLGRVFVMVWSRREIVKTWLDAQGGIDLHTRESMVGPDPLMLEAARMMIDEEYNGLESGRGKDAVVQLVRAFVANGHPLDVDAWLRAYFAAGGSFRHAESIHKLLGEMKKGVRHRVRDRYVDDIFDLIQDRAAAPAR